MRLWLIFALVGQDEFAGDFDLGAVVQVDRETSIGAVPHVEPIKFGDFLFVDGGGDKLGDDGVHIVVWCSYLLLNWEIVGIDFDD